MNAEVEVGRVCVGSKSLSKARKCMSKLYLLMGSGGRETAITNLKFISISATVSEQIPRVEEHTETRCYSGDGDCANDSVPYHI